MRDIWIFINLCWWLGGECVPLAMCETLFFASVLDGGKVCSCKGVKRDWTWKQLCTRWHFITVTEVGTKIKETLSILVAATTVVRSVADPSTPSPPCSPAWRASPGRVGRVEARRAMGGPLSPSTPSAKCRGGRQMFVAVISSWGHVSETHLWVAWGWALHSAGLCGCPLAEAGGPGAWSGWRAGGGEQASAAGLPGVRQGWLDGSVTSGAALLLTSILWGILPPSAVACSDSSMWESDGQEGAAPPPTPPRQSWVCAGSPLVPGARLVPPLGPARQL